MSMSRAELFVSGMATGALMALACYLLAGL